MALPYFRGETRVEIWLKSREGVGMIILRTEEEWNAYSL